MAHQAFMATTFLPRLKGLMGKKNLPKGEALIIKPCNSIHTCFMKFKIDAVFLNASNTVIFFIKEMNRFRISPIVKNAVTVIEFPVGLIEKGGIKIGSKIIFKE